MDDLYHFQPWEEKMKTAFEQGKLVLLQNLDPSLSSAEVQVIIISYEVQTLLLNGVSVSDTHLYDKYR